jgi:hypothetical protein
VITTAPTQQSLFTSTPAPAEVPSTTSFFKPATTTFTTSSLFTSSVQEDKISKTVEVEGKPKINEEAVSSTP